MKIEGQLFIRGNANDGFYCFLSRIGLAGLESDRFKTIPEAIGETIATILENHQPGDEFPKLEFIPQTT